MDWSINMGIIGKDNRESFIKLFLDAPLRKIIDKNFLTEDYKWTIFAKATTARWQGLITIRGLGNRSNPVIYAALPCDMVVALRNGNNISHYNYAVLSRKERKFYWRQCIADALDLIDALGCAPEELPLHMGPDVYKENLEIIERRLKEV